MSQVGDSKWEWKFVLRVKNGSLEDFPIILQKIMNNKNVNHLSRGRKNEVVNTKNLQIITRQWTKTREDKGKSISTIPPNHDYPNLVMQREIFKDSSQIIKDLATQEDNLDHQNTIIN